MTFGIVHVRTANFVGFWDTRAEADAELAEWRDYERGEQFEIIEFDDEGAPV